MCVVASHKLQHLTGTGMEAALQPGIAMGSCTFGIFRTAKSCALVALYQGDCIATAQQPCRVSGAPFMQVGSATFEQPVSHISQAHTTQPRTLVSLSEGPPRIIGPDGPPIPLPVDLPGCVTGFVDDRCDFIVIAADKGVLLALHPETYAVLDAMQVCWLVGDHDCLSIMAEPAKSIVYRSMSSCDTEADGSHRVKRFFAIS